MNIAGKTTKTASQAMSVLLGTAGPPMLMDKMLRGIQKNKKRAVKMAKRPPDIFQTRRDIR
jgi:hypothetical protein